jgi:hypothetical protein
LIDRAQKEHRCEVQRVLMVFLIQFGEVHCRQVHLHESLKDGCVLSLLKLLEVLVQSGISVGILSLLQLQLFLHFVNEELFSHLGQVVRGQRRDPDEL